MSKNFLEIQDATFLASKNNKVKDVNFNIEKEGDIISLLGPSGIGKTTILRTIAGLQKLQYGKIVLKGKVISSDISLKARDKILPLVRIISAGKDTKLPSGNFLKPFTNSFT